MIVVKKSKIKKLKPKKSSKAKNRYKSSKKKGAI